MLISVGARGGDPGIQPDSCFSMRPAETMSAGKRGHLLKGGRLHRPHGKSMMGKGDGMKLAIRPLTPDLWPALEDLFGVNGAVGGCWCMYWRIGIPVQRAPCAAVSAKVHRPRQGRFGCGQETAHRQDFFDCARRLPG